VPKSENQPGVETDTMPQGAKVPARSATDRSTERDPANGFRTKPVLGGGGRRPARRGNA